jgi:hypothetical protein
VTCADSQLTIDPNYWLPVPPISSIGFRIKEDTILYRCLNSNACLEPKPGELTVTCDASLGYQGVVCGDCSMNTGFVRTGEQCGKCLDVVYTVLIVLALALLFVISMIHYVAVMKFDAGNSEDTSSTALKMLM